MAASRILALVGVLLFLGAALYHRSNTLLGAKTAPAGGPYPSTLSLRQEPMRADPAEAARRERVQRFWSAYREASQKRTAGDLEGAIDGYRRALALNPDHEDGLYYLGACYFSTGRYPEAVGTARRLIAANPLGSSRGYMQLALLHACLVPGAPWAPTKAEQFFGEAFRVDPDSGALLGLGEVALLRGRWQQAWEELRHADADNPMSVAAPYLLGYLCWRKGDRAEAWRWFRMAIQRCRVKKPPRPEGTRWTEEGDVKADPELRWRALACQSVFGREWIRLRSYLKSPDLAPPTMEREYRRLHDVLAAARRRSLPSR